MAQKIRIKLKSYDHNLVDKSAEKIVKESTRFFAHPT
jgi:small subunit ribosomal protein S10